MITPITLFALAIRKLVVFAGLGEKVLEYLVIMMMVTTIPGDPRWGPGMF